MQQIILDLLISSYALALGIDFLKLSDLNPIPDKDFELVRAQLFPSIPRPSIGNVQSRWINVGFSKRNKDANGGPLFFDLPSTSSMGIVMNHLGNEAFDPFLAAISRQDSAEETRDATQGDSVEFTDLSDRSRSGVMDASNLDDFFPEHCDSLSETRAKSPFVSDHGTVLFDSIYQTWSVSFPSCSALKLIAAVTVII